MKLTIDITNKTVKVLEPVTFKELTEALKVLLPGIWEDYTLDIGQDNTNWIKTITIPAYPTYPTYPTYPFYETYDINWEQNANVINIEYEQR